MSPSGARMRMSRTFTIVPKRAGEIRCRRKVEPRSSCGFSAAAPGLRPRGLAAPRRATASSRTAISPSAACAPRSSPCVEERRSLFPSAGDANWIHATGPAPTASNRLPLIDFGRALATVLNDEPNEATDEKKHEPQKEHRPPVKRRREINALPLASGNGPAAFYWGAMFLLGLMLLLVGGLVGLNVNNGDRKSTRLNSSHG